MRKGEGVVHLVGTVELDMTGSVQLVGALVFDACKGQDGTNDAVGSWNSLFLLKKPRLVNSDR